MLANLLKKCLYQSGALSVYHRLRNRDVLTVVMYHRVLSPADPRWASADPDYTISEDLFSATVGFLKRHYNIVGADQVIEARRGTSRLPPRALLITFDDGWSDNIDYALPILCRENVPALMFIVADAIDSHRPFFQEELVAAWQSGRLSPTDLGAIADKVGAAGVQLPIDDLAKLRGLIAALELLPSTERSSILRPYAERVNDGLRHMVAAKELGRLREGKVAIGSHGKTHTPLTRADDLDAELGGARRIVARHVGVESSQLVTMSFPHGRWSPEILQRARSHGYELVFTSAPALNRLDQGCSDVLGRVGIEAGAVHDERGRFRPEWLALRLFRRPVERFG
ncbi:MAG: polysaccharide deacetylase family protein [Betaproteobacteria bacterium]|nr:polysaccharide deacetylase family protein [Betaproteobacteria bacterium]